MATDGTASQPVGPPRFEFIGPTNAAGRIAAAAGVARAAGARVTEVPITFTERTFGRSKMSGSIVREALVRVTVWGLKDRLADWLAERVELERPLGGDSRLRQQPHQPVRQGLALGCRARARVAVASRLTCFAHKFYCLTPV